MIRKLIITSMLALSTMFAAQSVSVPEASNIAFAKNCWVYSFDNNVDVYVDDTSIHWTSNSSFEVTIYAIPRHDSGSRINELEFFKKNGQWYYNDYGRPRSMASEVSYNDDSSGYILDFVLNQR